MWMLRGCHRYRNLVTNSLPTMIDVERRRLAMMASPFVLYRNTFVVN